MQQCRREILRDSIWMSHPGPGARAVFRVPGTRPTTTNSQGYHGPDARHKDGTPLWCRVMLPSIYNRFNLPRVREAEETAPPPVSINAPARQFATKFPSL